MGEEDGGAEDDQPDEDTPTPECDECVESDAEDAQMDGSDDNAPADTSDGNEQGSDDETSSSSSAPDSASKSDPSGNLDDSTTSPSNHSDEVDTPTSDEDTDDDSSAECPDIGLFRSVAADSDIWTRREAVDDSLLADSPSGREQAAREIKTRLLSTLDGSDLTAGLAISPEIAGDLEDLRELADDFDNARTPNPNPVSGFLGFAMVNNDRELVLPHRLVRTVPGRTGDELRGAQVPELFALDKTIYFGYFKEDNHPVLGDSSPTLARPGETPNQNHVYWFITPNKTLIDKADGSQVGVQEGQRERVKWNYVEQNHLREDNQQDYYYVTVPKKFYPHFKGRNIADRPVPDEVQGFPLPSEVEEGSELERPPGRQIYALIHQNISTTSGTYPVLYLYTWNDIKRLPPEVLLGLFQHSQQFTWFKNWLIESINMGAERAALFELWYFIMAYDLPPELIKDNL